MQKKLTMSDEMRLLEEGGYLVTNSSRTVTIWMRHLETGHICSKMLLQDFWEQEYSCRCFKKARLEEGFEVSDVPNFPVFGMEPLGPRQRAIQARTH